MRQQVSADDDGNGANDQKERDCNGDRFGALVAPLLLIGLAPVL